MSDIPTAYFFFATGGSFLLGFGFIFLLAKLFGLQIVKSSGVAVAVEDQRKREHKRKISAFEYGFREVQEGLDRLSTRLYQEKDNEQMDLNRRGKIDSVARYVKQASEAVGKSAVYLGYSSYEGEKRRREFLNTADNYLRQAFKNQDALLGADKRDLQIYASNLASLEFTVLKEYEKAKSRGFKK